MSVARPKHRLLCAMISVPAFLTFLISFAISSSILTACVAAACTYVSTAIFTTILLIRCGTMRDLAINLLVQHWKQARKCSCRGCQDAAKVFNRREDMLEIKLRQVQQGCDE